MSADAWLTVAIIALMVIGLMKEVFTPDVLVLGALILLLLLGIVTPEEAFRGFSNPAMVTVGALFVVARAMSTTGALDVVAHTLFGRTRSVRLALLKLTGVTALLSAFLNNTPIVAMFMPLVDGFGRRANIPPSKLLIPLSYAAILGGVCTLIGTSTNLVVSGLLDERGMGALGMFELSWVGVPVALVGITYIIFVGPWLLPDRGDPLAVAEAERKRYMAELVLVGPSGMIGKSVEAAGLRHLPGLFLVRIEREGRTVSPVAPEEVLLEGDRLVFAGVVDTLKDLQKRGGLVPATAPDAPPPADWRLVEAVIGPTSPLSGTTIRDANFRGRYGAAVVAIHRNGALLDQKIGDVALSVGDTLLLEARPGFAKAHRGSDDFLLVGEVVESAPARRARAWAPILALFLVVGLATFDVLPVVMAALLGAVLCGVSRALDPAEARRSVDPSVLSVIGASFGLATAMEKTGAAQVIADNLVSLGAGFGPFGTLAAVFLATMLMTETISNNAAAALMFPIAVAAAGRLGLSPHPFAVTVAIAASLSFMSPLGYQTNLMVYGPGGYRFLDFMRVGLPMQLAVGATALVCVWLRWM